MAHLRPTRATHHSDELATVIRLALRARKHSPATIGLCRFPSANSNNPLAGFGPAAQGLGFLAVLTQMQRQVQRRGGLPGGGLT